MRVFYDGACPICSREIGWLKRRIPEGNVNFEDLSLLQQDGSRCGISRKSLMQEIHAITPNGEVLKGMEVIRRLYVEAGLGWILSPTGWPGLKRLFDFAYRVFARNRAQLGRVLRKPAQ